MFEDTVSCHVTVVNKVQNFISRSDFTLNECFSTVCIVGISIVLTVTVKPLL